MIQGENFLNGPGGRVSTATRTASSVATRDHRRAFPPSSSCRLRPPERGGPPRPCRAGQDLFVDCVGRICPPRHRKPRRTQRSFERQVREATDRLSCFRRAAKTRSDSRQPDAAAASVPAPHRLVVAVLPRVAEAGHDSRVLRLYDEREERAVAQVLRSGWIGLGTEDG